MHKTKPLAKWNVGYTPYVSQPLTYLGLMLGPANNIKSAMKFWHEDKGLSRKWWKWWHRGRKRSWTDLENWRKSRLQYTALQVTEGKLAHECAVKRKKALGIRTGKCLQSIYRFFQGLKSNRLPRNKFKRQRLKSQRNIQQNEAVTPTNSRAVELQLSAHPPPGPLKFFEILVL